MSDAVIWMYLAADILEAEAAQRLPAPPLVPRFAAETVRPKGRAS